MVSLVVPNLVKIDAVVSKTWNFQYFARLAGKRLFTPQKLAFWGYFTSQMRSNINETPKMHILVRVRIVWAINRENTSTGLTCRWVHEKGISLNKKNSLHFTHLLRGPRGRICIKFGAAVGVADIITSNKFFGDWSTGMDSVGSNIALSHWHKKLSYRRVTARCVLSVVILSVTTQQCRNYLYDKSWPNRWYEVGGLVGGNVS